MTGDSCITGRAGEISNRLFLTVIVVFTHQVINLVLGITEPSYNDRRSTFPNDDSGINTVFQLFEKNITHVGVILGYFL